MAAPAWKEQADRLERLLGFKFLHSWQAGPNSDFDGCVSQVRGTEIEFEIISPAGERSFLQKFLSEQGASSAAFANMTTLKRKAQ